MMGLSGVRLTAVCGFACLLGLAACREEKASGFRPDIICPGDPSGICKDRGDGKLWVGASKRAITPEITETFMDKNLDAEWGEWLPYVDLDGNDEWGADEPLSYVDENGNGSFDHGEPLIKPADAGDDRVKWGKEPFNDRDSDGEFDAVWIAGFQNGRPANGVHDDLWARGVVLRQNETTIALVALDLIGYFYDRVVEIREMLDRSLGVDHIVVASTHVHEGPDSMGIWGPDEITSGVDESYMALVRDAVLDLIGQAAGNMVEARVTVGQRATVHHPIAGVEQERGIGNLIHDSRDPVIIDDMVYAMKFEDLARGDTIATIVNWSNHPETLCDRNNYITSDFPHYLREGVERGVDIGGGNPVEGVGGVCVFFNGALGGMMTPLGLSVLDRRGAEYSEGCAYVEEVDDPFFGRAEAIGELVAEEALTALKEGETLTGPRLSFKAKSFYVTIENWAFHAMMLNDVFNRGAYNYDPTAVIEVGNLPDILTEVDVITLGEAQIVTIPGELLPELAIGGYDGSKTGPLQQVIDSGQNRDPTHPDYNPPDLSQAPAPPYIRDLMRGKYKFLFGLANDELGYIVPPYDYKLAEGGPYIEEAPGDHYEETNSCGIEAAPTIIGTLEKLLDYGRADAD